MADKIAEEEIRRRYVIFMRFPNETLTDVFKLFSRRILVQNISPACKRLKNISNRVKSIHVITEVNRFNAKLWRDDPEANQQLEHLAGNNCQLDSQFTFIKNTYLRILEQNKVILRHCIELFRGWRLSFTPIGNQRAALMAECLTHLEAAKPIAITINLYCPKLLNQLLRHPTIWECSRVRFAPPYFVDLMPIAATFLDWLHHQPTGVDGDGSAHQHEHVRCLIIKCNYKMVQGDIDWLINGCIQNFKQSQDTKDRRRFVLSFSAWDRDDDENIQLDQFERQHNQMTGEVLLLEHADASNPRAMVYRLRRCLAEEAANGDEFYGKTFKQRGPWDEFAVNDGPMVFNPFLRHPTIWNCSRLYITQLHPYDAMQIAVPLLDWLHHHQQQPIGVDGLGDGAEQEQVRCLNIKGYNVHHVKKTIGLLINGCIQNLQQSRASKDRRRFVLSFFTASNGRPPQLDQFERQHNQITGETLLLEQTRHYFSTEYRLRRCLAEEAANGKEFFGKIFKLTNCWGEYEFAVDEAGPIVDIDCWREEMMDDENDRL